MPVIDIEISSCNRFVGPQFLIQGTRGTLAGGSKELEWSYYIEGDEKTQSLTLDPLVNAKGEPVFCREELTFHSGAWRASGDELDEYGYRHLAFYDAFYDAISNGAEFPIKLSQILLQMKIIDEAFEQNKRLWA
jgi:hypothetical protein